MTKQCVLKEEDISTEFNAYETLPVYRYLDRIYACNQGNDSAIEEFEKGSIYLLSLIIFYLGNNIAVGTRYLKNEQR